MICAHWSLICQPTTSNTDTRILLGSEPIFSSCTGSIFNILPIIFYIFSALDLCVCKLCLLHVCKFCVLYVYVLWHTECRTDLKIVLSWVVLSVFLSLLPSPLPPPPAYCQQSRPSMSLLSFLPTQYTDSQQFVPPFSPLRKKRDMVYKRNKIRMLDFKIASAFSCLCHWHWICTPQRYPDSLSPRLKRIFEKLRVNHWKGQH